MGWHRGDADGFPRRDKSGNYLVEFRYGGKKYTRSLDTKEAAEAAMGIARVEETIYLLNRGLREMPDGAEPGIFIVSGGRLTGIPAVEPAESTAPHTVKTLFDLYQAELPPGAKGKGTLITENIHITHLLQHLKEDTPFASLDTGFVQSYVKARIQDGVKPRTIKNSAVGIRLRAAKA